MDDIDQEMIQQLRDLADGADTILAEVVDLFAADAPQRIAQMRQAIADDDAEALHQAAHTLKGSCSNLGLRTLQEACAALDQMARSHQLSDAGPGLERVTEAFAHSMDFLRTELGRD